MRNTPASRPPPAPFPSLQFEICTHNSESGRGGPPLTALCYHWSTNLSLAEERSFRSLVILLIVDSSQRRSKPRCCFVSTFDLGICFPRWFCPNAGNSSQTVVFSLAQDTFKYRRLSPSLAIVVFVLMRNYAHC